MRGRCGERKKKKNEKRRMKSEERERERERERVRGQERRSVGDSGEGDTVGPAPVARATICIVVLCPRVHDRWDSHCLSVTPYCPPNGEHFRADSRPLPQMLHRDSKPLYCLQNPHLPTALSNQ